MHPLILLVLPLFLAGCTAGSDKAGLVAGRDKAGLVSTHLPSLPSVYSRYLTYPVPSEGIVAEFNPPVLRWPLARKKSPAYDVRLSMDSSFNSDSQIKIAQTPWAMFNPHQKLETGKWFWQYRTAGEGWSDVQTFKITSASIELVSPPVLYFLENIPMGHPRVLAEKSEFAALRRLPRNGDVNAILGEAEKALSGKIPTETEGIPEREGVDEERDRKFRQDASQRLGDFVFKTVEPLCQAYILTGDERYRRRGIEIALEVARWDPSGVTGSGTSDFADARCMLVMALALDTFYDDLSMAEKNLLLNASRTRAKGFYQSWINNQEARVLSGHVWQHILHYFFQTALALHGDDPAADDWLAYAYELFLARTPILGGTDGGWTEGVSYFRMNMETVLEIPLFIQKYTGFDFINSHPWYGKNIEWMIYHIPPGSSADGFGDNTEEVFMPGSHYVAYATEMAKLRRDPLASWYAQKCKEYEPVHLPENRILRWIRTTRTRDLALPLPASDPQLPIGKCFRDIGLVSMHTNPENTADDLMVAMRSGPFGCYGHFLSDHNAFNILYGGKRTFFRTGYKVTMKDPHRTEWYQHTKSNNSILIDGEGQPYSTEAFGWIRGFIAGRDMAYALGDASNAYSSAETNEDHGVKKFYRHLILLKPNIIVIYDELESEEEAAWTWLIHSMEQIFIDRSENSFVSTFDQAKGIGKLWSSHPVMWALADTFDVPAVNWRGSRDASGKIKTYDDRQWHLKATSKSLTPAMRFLTVLQVTPDASPDKVIEDQEGEGIKIRAGKWWIEATLNTTLAPALRIRDESGTATLVYNGKDTVRMEEVQDGERRSKEATVAMPWYMEQSWRQLNRRR